MIENPCKSIKFLENLLKSIQNKRKSMKSIEDRLKFCKLSIENHGNQWKSTEIK